MRRLVSSFLAGFLLTAPASAQNTLFPANPGDMIARGTHAWTAVPGGTAGCVLTSNGPAAAPTWQCALALNFQLPPMATNKIWGNVSGTSAAASEIDVNQFLNTIDYDIQRPPLPGSVPYKGTDNKWHTAPPPAAVGWVWTAQGTGVIPQWAPPGGYVPPGALGTCLVSNGTTVAPSFQTCPSAVSYVSSVGGVTGAITVGNGLVMVGSKISEAGYPVFRPEDYGAVCDNSTDNSVAFANLATAVNAAATGRIEFARNCVYQVYPAPVIDQVVMNINALNGLTINFNGSTIATTYNFAAARQIYGILLNGSMNVTINDPKFDQQNYHTRNFDRGFLGIFGTGAVDNILITNFTMNGGESGFGCNRAVSGPKGKNINIIGASFSNVFYPINAQKSCENLNATGITIVQPGRSFFVYNVSNMYAQINSDASDGFNDIVIENAYDAADLTQDAYLTSNIRVDYTNRPSVGTGTGVDSYATIQFQTTPGSVEGYQQITDIHLNMDVQRNDARGAAALLKINSITSTAKGRLLENVYVTGRGQVASVTPSAFMYLMMDKDWTGDRVRNLQFTNLICNYQAAAPFQIDGRAIDGPIILNGVWGNTNCTFSPTNMGGTTAAFPFLSYNQVWLPTAITPGALPVANLPACNATNVGTRYSVSDANATTFHSVVAGGGANIVDVVCLNSNWTIGG